MAEIQGLAFANTCEPATIAIACSIMKNALRTQWATLRFGSIIGAVFRNANAPCIQALVREGGMQLFVQCADVYKVSRIFTQTLCDVFVWLTCHNRDGPSAAAITIQAQLLPLMYTLIEQHTVYGFGFDATLECLKQFVVCLQYAACLYRSVPKFWTHQTKLYCFCGTSVPSKACRSRKRVA